MDIIVLGTLCLLGVGAAYGYTRFRGATRQARQYRYLVASFSSLPLALLVIVLGLWWATSRIAGNKPSADLNALSVTLLFAYYVVPSPIGVVYLAAAVSAVVLAWKGGVDSGPACQILTGCTAIVGCFVGYVAWWHLTGQHWVYL